MLRLCCPLFSMYTDVTIITEIQSAHLIVQTSFFYGHPCIDVANLPSWTGPIHSIVLL